MLSECGWKPERETVLTGVPYAEHLRAALAAAARAP